MSQEIAKRKRQRPANVQSLKMESQLQELLFGNDMFSGSEKQGLGLDEIEIIVDRKPDLVPAWVDREDDILNVDLNLTDNRLKKLKNKSKQRTVSGSEMSSLLRERFQTLPLEWARIQSDDVDEGRSILCRTGALRPGRIGDTSSGIGLRFDLNDRMQSVRLAAGTLQIARMMDANAESPSNKTVTAVKFHPATGVMLAAGLDRQLRFFRVDGEHNQQLLSVEFPDMPVRSAAFLGESSEVVLAGRTPYFYSYDSASGSVQKNTALLKKGLNSHENMSVSPDGSKIAFVGAGGYVHICNGSSKTWMADVKMNGAARVATFVGNTTLATSGLDAEVYIWDLRYTSRCLSRFKHEDGSCTSALAASLQDNGSVSQYFAVGAESGVTSVFSPETSVESSRRAFPAFTPMKSIMNLTHRVTSLAFHPSAQILAMASDQEKDALKLLHLPSCTVFSNWPTEKSPIRRATCLEFSPGGAYLAVGNNRGRVLLYKINEFASV